MPGKPDTGGEPEDLAECTECGQVYPVQEMRGGEIRPIGTDGICDCGNGSFVLLSNE